jgi:C1A family cysteine protease
MKRHFLVHAVLIVLFTASISIAVQPAIAGKRNSLCLNGGAKELNSNPVSYLDNLNLAPTPFPETDGWFPGETSVSRLSEEEQNRLLGVPADVAKWEEEQAQLQAESLSSKHFTYPPEIDWRNYQGQDWTTPVRYQGRCASCVAFATVAAIESRMEISLGTSDLNPDLSENHLFFCDCGQCCDQGWVPLLALDFAVNTGIVDESCDPYDDVNQICSPCSDWVERVIKIHHREETSSSEYAKWSIATKGPVITTMNVYNDFFSYTGGIYRHSWGYYRGLHAVTLVGYNDAEGYWIGKNSWGKNWGEEGWFRIAYGEVKIDDYFYIPIIEALDPDKICEGVTEIPAGECGELVDFYAYTHGDSWDQRTGWVETKTPCSWYGVECQDGHVVGLVLPDNGLRGLFPLDLSDLNALTTLKLSHNELTGYIYGGVVRLTNLRSLDLADNQLIGGIPLEIGNLTDLRELQLDHNRFHSLNTNAMEHLTQLIKFNLSSNAFVGDISINFMNLINLDDGGLDIGYNALSTSDPDLQAFLMKKDPDWAISQTVPPTDLQACIASSTSVKLTWTPIHYISDGGWYEVMVAEEDGYFSLDGKTLDKTISEYIVENLNPGMNYRFVVRTFTPAHYTQQNDLFSHSSEEVQIRLPLLELHHVFIPLVKGE